MSTSSQTFVSRINWIPNSSGVAFTPTQENTITNMLNEILATNAGAALVNDYADPSGTATINIVNSYGLGSHADATVPGVLTLKFDFAQMTQGYFIDTSGAVVGNDPSEVISHEFTHLSGLKDTISATPAGLIDQIAKTIGDPPTNTTNPAIDFSNLIKDQMRGKDPSISHDRVNPEAIGPNSYAGDFPSGSTFTSDPNANDYFGVAMSGYSGVVHWDQFDNSLLLGPETGGNSLDIYFGGWSNVAVGTGGILNISLTNSTGIALGTLNYNSSGSSTVTLQDGTVVNLSAFPTNAVVLDALTSTTLPEASLLSYLSDLGDSTTASALDTLNYTDLNPTGSAYTLTGTVSGSNDTFTDTSGGPGAVITGVTGKNNILIASGDLTQDTISNIQQATLSYVTLTGAQFNSFSSITGGGSLTIASSGSYSIASKGTGFTELTAQDWGGTTLTGSNTNSQELVASLFGNDTLHAGNGTGDILVAGDGVDTITGGTGGDIFLTDGLATGSSITGTGTGNTLEASGDISGATVTGVQTLSTGEVTLNATELASFSSIANVSNQILNANGSGSFSVASSSSEFLTMNADETDDQSLTGNNAGYNTIDADNTSGDDSLTVNDTSGSTGYNTVSTQNSDGNNTLTMGNGSNDTLTVAGSFGNNTLTGGSGGDTFDATDSIGTNTMHGGSGADTFITGIGVNIVTGGGGGDTFDVIDGLAAGSSISDSGTGNVLAVNGDISGAAISGVQTLSADDVTLNATELAGFSSVSMGYDSTVIANGAGTYSLGGITFSGGLTVDTDATDNITLTGGAADMTLSAANSSGNDTLTAGSGVSVILSAQGSTGNDTLNAGSGGDILYAGLGDDTLNGGTGIDAFYFTGRVGAGTTVTGGGGTDDLYAQTSDISNLTVTSVPVLLDYSASLTLSGSAFSQLTNLANDYGTGATLIVVGSGSYSLTGKTVTGSAFTLITDGGTTITGNNMNGQALYANPTGTSTVNAGTGTGDFLYAGSGTDTLNAGSGGDTLVAGAGTDTLTGSSGNDTFVVGNALASGDTLNGGTGTNGMQITAANASIASATISNITSLEIKNGASTTLTLSQFNAFSTYTADSGAGAVKLSGAGTYSLSGKTVSGALTLDASASSGNFTLTGSSAANETLDGSTGTDTITTGTGTGEIVNTHGTNNTVTSNGGMNSWVNANGAGDGVTLDGVLTTVVSNASGQTITSSANAETLDLYSTSATATVSGINTWAFITGNSNTLTTNSGSTGDNITASGTGEHLTLNAAYDTITATNSGDVISVTGTNSWINLNGTTDSVSFSDSAGDGDSSIIVNGNSDTVTTSGDDDGDYIALNGTSDTLTMNGTGLWVDVNGSGDTVTGTGSSAQVNINIAASSTTVSGKDDSFGIGSGVSTTISGGDYSYYEFQNTFGTDTINNAANGGITTANGQINFGSSTTDENLWFKQSGTNLVVDLLGTTDTITLTNWFGSNAGAQLSDFSAGSLNLTTQVSALVSAMATYAAAHTGFNPQTTGTTMPTDTTLQNAITTAWHT